MESMQKRKLGFTIHDILEENNETNGDLIRRSDVNFNLKNLADNCNGKLINNYDNFVYTNAAHYNNEMCNLQNNNFFFTNQTHFPSLIQSPTVSLHGSILNEGYHHHIPQFYNPYFPNSPAAYFHSYTKRKGGQIRFTSKQTDDLENKFIKKKYLSAEDRKDIATKLNLSDRQVKTWFQNRRAKWRRLNNMSSSFNYQTMDGNNLCKTNDTFENKTGFNKYQIKDSNNNINL